MSTNTTALRRPGIVEVPTEDIGSFDVVVVGGGLSGVCAAVAAARAGARTLLAEALPFIGGNGTTGLSISGLCARKSRKLVVRGLAFEILEMLERRSAVGDDFRTKEWIGVDAEKLQLVLSDFVAESGITVLTYSPLIAVERTGRTLTRASFYNKDGTGLRAGARTFVDSSGDAQVARLAGLETPMGRQRDGRTQTMSLVFSVAGIDEKRAISDAEVADEWNTLARDQHNWRNQRRDPSVSSMVGRPGWRSFIATRISVAKGTDNRLLAKAEFEGRKQVDEFVHKFLRPHVPGYERCYLAQIASHVGVRETRRIQGQYEISENDLLSGRKFPDSIACNAGSVETHDPDTGDVYWANLPDGEYYTVPYRALVARGVDNLVASGRCLSASHEALAALRVLSPAMATGQAAGTAAALAIETGTSVHDLDAQLIRQRLRAAGAVVD